MTIAYRMVSYLISSGPTASEYCSACPVPNHHWVSPERLRAPAWQCAELAMTAARCDEIPPISVKHAEDLSDLHAFRVSTHAKGCDVALTFALRRAERRPRARVPRHASECRGDAWSAWLERAGSVALTSETPGSGAHESNLATPKCAGRRECVSAWARSRRSNPQFPALARFSGRTAHRHCSISTEWCQLSEELERVRSQRA